VLYTNKLFAGVAMVTASVEFNSITCGINTPLLVAATSSIAEEFGVAPVVLIPTFCVKLLKVFMSKISVNIFLMCL